MVDGVTLDALKKKYKKLKKKAEVGKGDAKTSRKDTDANGLKLKKKKKLKDKDGVSKKRKSSSSGEGESPTKKKKTDSKSKQSGDGTNKKKTVGHLVIVPDAEKRKKQNSSPKKLKDITKVSKGGKKPRGRPKKIAAKGSGDAPTSSSNGTDVKPRVEDGVSEGEEEEDNRGGSEYSETSRWVMFDHRYSAVLKPQGKPSSSKNTYKHKHQPRPSREEEGRRQMVRMRKGKGKDVFSHSINSVVFFKLFD